MIAVQSNPPRVRPSFRRAAILACVLLLPLAIHAVWDYIEARRLSQAVEEIRRRGEPVHFGRVGEGRPTTAEQTRASRYYGAAALLTADAYNARFSKAAALIDAISRETAPIRASDPRLDELQNLADSYAPALDLIDRAARLDANGLDYASEPRYGFLERNLANVNALRVARLALTGEGDAATDALIATLRVKRVINPSFGLNFPIVTLDSVRLLATFSTPSERSLRALQKAFVERENEDAVSLHLLRSRATMIEAVWPGAQGELSTLPRVRNSRPRPYLLDGLIDTTLRPWYTNRFRRMLSIYAEAIEASKQPWPAKLEAARLLEERYPTNPQPFGQRTSKLSGPLGHFLLGNFPAAEFSRLTRQTASTLAQDRICVAVLAIDRYRHTHRDLPTSLDVLVPDFLPAVPKDPFTGAPLQYSRSAAEYTVYSAGQNGRDDGGDVGTPRSDLSTDWRRSDNDMGITISLSKKGTAQ